MDLPTKSIPPILEIYKRNPDILKRGFLAMQPPTVPNCTLEDEMKTPAHRPSVQQMIKDGRKPNKFKKYWKSNTGLGYYPFNR